MHIQQPLYDRVTLVIVLLGVFTACLGFLDEDRSRVEFKAGASLMLLAYFAVFIENFLSRRDISTRGGLVKYSDGFLRYSAPYLFFLIFGFFIGVFIATS